MQEMDKKILKFFIFGVKDTKSWNRENFQWNTPHKGSFE